MKIKINRNILWAEIFAKNVIAAGVKYACISPGSRSTPLTYAFASNSDITSYVHIDERSAAFFATGLARKSHTPVILLCTSGTAVAEFYPAIIEAYQQRIPLIVCTADRPQGSFSKGLNQTINQYNIYSNHIRWFCDAGLPDVNNFNYINDISVEAVQKSIALQGPVHINFPFDKPFEPESFTDEIEEMEFSTGNSSPENVSISKILPDSLSEEIVSEANGLITVGPSGFNKSFRDAILKLSGLSGYPVLADGASQLRFSDEVHPGIITNFDALFRSSFFIKNKPGIIIHFGRTMTSKGYEDFLLKYNGKKFLVNKYADVFDPSGRHNSLIAADEVPFLYDLVSYLNARGFKRKKSMWLEKVQNAERALCDLKVNTLQLAPFPDEGRIISEVINLIPEKWNLMLSNSSPVRDFDYFSGQRPIEINVFHNRGASGIDGITSTALGISAVEENTVLITGDLAFYHDMNGLLASSHYKIPLIIILINNNGGGIFRTLPVSGYKEVFSKYFITPHNLNFRNFIDGYGGVYKEIVSWEDLRNTFSEALNEKKLFIMEIKTDSEASLLQRRNYWRSVKELLNDNPSL